MRSYAFVQRTDYDGFMVAMRERLSEGWHLLGPVQTTCSTTQAVYLATLYRDTEGEDQ